MIFDGNINKMSYDIFKARPVLENERVLLRPIQTEDWEYLLPFSLYEPEIWKWGQITCAGEENLKNYVNSAVKNREDKKEYTFIVYDKLAKRYAGSTRFYDIQPAMGFTQLGFTWYGKEFQRSGLNRHCKLLILTYVFEEWKLERLELRAHAKNERSIQAMKDIGCVVEGILRSQMPTIDGTRRDSIVLSILKNEWFDTVKKQLQEKTR
jgi:RimJ/RimL family protein N-acetyltransferase